MMLRAAFVPPREVVEELRALTGRIGGLPGVRPEPPERLDVRIAGLGNVVDADARALARAIADQATLPEAPLVHCAGVRLLPDGDVVADLAGDAEALVRTARAVGRAAERINLYVDRRVFRPAVVVASLSAQRPGSRVAAALGRLAGGEGSPWTVSEVALIRTRWLAGRAVHEVLDAVPIAPGVTYVTE